VSDDDDKSDHKLTNGGGYDDNELSQKDNDGVDSERYPIGGREIKTAVAEMGENGGSDKS
jgi:hypothetical protein